MVRNHAWLASQDVRVDKLHAFQSKLTLSALSNQPKDEPLGDPQLKC